MAKIQPCHLNFAARMEAEHAVYPRYVELLGEEGAARQAKETADRYLAAIAAYVEPLRPESEEVRHRARKPRRQPALSLLENSKIFGQIIDLMAATDKEVTRQKMCQVIGCTLPGVQKITVAAEEEGFLSSRSVRTSYTTNYYTLTAKGKEEAARRAQLAKPQSEKGKVLSLPLRNSELFKPMLLEIERRRGKATRKELADACGRDLATISAIAVLAEQENFLICRQSLGRAKTYCLSDKGRAYLTHLKKEGELCQSHQ